MIAKKYQFESGKKRESLNLAIMKTFKILDEINLINQMMNDNNEQNLYVVYLVFKVLYFANDVEIVSYFREKGELERWIEKMRYIMDEDCL